MDTQQMEVFRQQVAEAEQNYRVTQYDAYLTPRGPVVYVEAEAKTGSRYSVAVTPLPMTGQLLEGGPLLVTVMHPWQAAYALQPVGYLDDRYVMEKFIPASIKDRGVHGGDVKALTMTIAHALGRFDG